MASDSADSSEIQGRKVLDVLDARAVAGMKSEYPQPSSVWQLYPLHREERGEHDNSSEVR